MENIKGEHPTKPPLCRHSVKQTSALNQFLERMGSTSGRALSCQKCKKEMGEPPKQMKENFLGGKILWGCLDCEQIFCGVLSYSGPGGHICHHAESSKHLLAVPIAIWCFACNSPKVITAEEEGKENNESEKDVMEESIGIEREELKGLTSSNMGVYRVRLMENFGDTCFYNAVLQNLLSMNSLRTIFENLDLQEDCRPLTKKLYNLVIVSSSEVPISPYLHDLFSSICEVNRDFGRMGQQDSHEFLGCLRNGLLAEGTSSVDDTFQGMLTQYTSCRCGYISTSIVPFYDLSLALPSERSSIKKDERVTCKDIVFPARNKDRGQENGIAAVCSVAKADGAELSGFPSNGNGYAEPGSPESSNISSCLTVPIDKWFKNMSLCLTVPIDNWFKNLSVLSRDKVAADIDKRDKSEVEKEDSNLNFADESIMVSDSEVCGEDVNIHPNNGAPLSIQSCLDFFTAVLPVPFVCSCCKNHLEYPNTGPEGEWKSETSNFQGNDSKDMGMDSMGTTKTEIFMAPTILTIHFKKFKYDTSGEKIVCHINFQEKLDLTPYMASGCRGKEEFHYRLIGVVEHLGSSLSSGHYVAYVKGVGSEGGKDIEGGGLAWFRADDDRELREVPLQEVLKTQRKDMMKAQEAVVTAATATGCIPSEIIAQIQIILCLPCQSLARFRSVCKQWKWCSSTKAQETATRYIPSEIIAQIILRLPCRSLARFRSVSKQWCSIIDDPLFASKYNEHRRRTVNRPRYFLVFSPTLYRSDRYSKLELFRIVDDGHIYTERKHVHKHLDMMSNSCCGLVCFHCARGCIVAYNPTSKKTITLPKYPEPYMPFYGAENRTFAACRNLLGFGFHPQSNSYKVVQLVRDAATGGISMCHVLTVGRTKTSWRAADDARLDFSLTDIRIHERVLCVDGTLYWENYASPNAGGSRQIVAFDLGDDTIGTIPSPRENRADGGPGDDMRHLAELHGKLCYKQILLSCDGSLQMDISVLSQGASVEWARLYRLELGPYPRKNDPSGEYVWLHPLCMQRDHRILLMDEKRLYFYDVKEKRLREYRADGCSEQLHRYYDTVFRGFRNGRANVHAEELVLLS